MLRHQMITSNNVDSASMPNLFKKLFPWLVWGLAASYFFSDYFARVSPSVMTTQLMHAFHIGALGIGSLSAYFYAPYLAMQIPVGLLVDRFSVRALLTVMALLTALGCIVFATAHALVLAELGRFLLGFSASFAFVGSLKLASCWFPSNKLGLLAGLTQAAGMFGAAVGDAPVAYLVRHIGWRETMFLMAIVFIILSVCILIIVRDRPTRSSITNTSKREQLSIRYSLLKVLSNTQTWMNALYAGLVYAPTAAFAELWGVSYLQFGRGLSHGNAAFAIGLIFIGWAIGGPIYGWISDYIGKRRPLMFISALAGAVLLSLLFLLPHLSVFSIYALCFLFGVSNTGVAISYAVSTEINTQNVIGTSIAFTNMASVIIGAMLQPVIGLLIDVFNGPHFLTMAHQTGAVVDLRIAFIVLPICSLLGFFCTLFIRETHCKPVLTL